MTPCRQCPSSGVSALIFGPQATGFGLDSFNVLRSKLFENTRGRWALDTLGTLPEAWKSISSSIAIFKHYDGDKLLHDLEDWLETGQIPPSAFPLPNILLAPLVVIDHLTSYADFLRAAIPDLSDDQALPVSAKTRLETLGLSLGTLSAFAVSSSSTLSELQRYGAVAIRLAMLVGAVGDAEDLSRSPEQRSLSFSPFWKSKELHSVMMDTLGAVPEVSSNASLSTWLNTILNTH